MFADKILKLQLHYLDCVSSQISACIQLLVWGHLSTSSLLAVDVLFFIRGQEILLEYTVACMEEEVLHDKTLLVSGTFK